MASLPNDICPEGPAIILHRQGDSPRDSCQAIVKVSVAKVEPERAVACEHSS